MLTADSSLTADGRLPADGLILAVTPGYVVSVRARVWRVAARSLRAWIGMA